MNLSDNHPDRPAFRYPGAKWLGALKILPLLPSSHETYIEPFAGSLGVLLRKPRSKIEAVNDLDGDVVNFFRVLRDQPERIIEVIELTPFAYEEFQGAFEPTDDPVERARRFYVRAYLSIAGPTAQRNSGWRRQVVYSRGRAGNKDMTPAAHTFANVDHLLQIAGRLRGVVIEQMDALEMIQTYDNERALFYVDPPYVTSTLNSAWAGYLYSNSLTDEQHREMADVLNNVKGMVALSGYRCELYDELFEGWTRHDFDLRTNGEGSKTESLWLNQAAVNAEGHTDLPLFAGGK